tara:strand:- start:63675 stop:64316 length:642 start_codon:yes stop_codon:yes gene_type:complete
MDDLPSDEDIALGAWDGEESSLAQLVMKHAGAFEVSIRRQYPQFDEPTAEDVVSEGIRRFWEVRERYDGERPLAGFVYGFIKNAAREHAACRLKWQKTRQKEVYFDALGDDFPDPKIEEKLDEIESEFPELLEALKKILDRLKPVHREIWLTFALACTEIDAGELGKQLGEKHNQGVPIPAGTVRVNKSRTSKIVRDELKKLGFDLNYLEQRQ